MMSAAFTICVALVGYSVKGEHKYSVKTKPENRFLTYLQTPDFSYYFHMTVVDMQSVFLDYKDIEEKLALYIIAF